MNGLLDFLKAPAGQGLLSAGFGYMAGANSRTPVQNLGRAGLAGVLGYNGAMSSEAERQKGQLAAQAEQRKQDALAQLSPEDRLAVNAGLPYETLWIRRNPEEKYVDGYDANGRPIKGVLKGGVLTQIGGFQAKPVDYKDAGGKLIPTDPYTGLPTGGGIAKTMTPGERDASARGWAGIGLQREEKNKPTYNADAAGYIVPVSAANPNGGFIPLQGGQAGKPLTEAQGKAAGFANRMFEAEKIMADPNLQGAQKPELFASVLETLPIVGGVAGRSAQSSARDQVRQAQENWVRANLRKESGAVIGADEMREEVKNYFPQIGDSDAVIKQKAHFRRTVANGMAREAGRSYKPPAGSGGDVFSEADKIINGGR